MRIKIEMQKFGSKISQLFKQKIVPANISHDTESILVVLLLMNMEIIYRAFFQKISTVDREIFVVKSFVNHLQQQKLNRQNFFFDI